ncbi:membrane protein [Acrocarpospora phusangensis]|uniref:Membrane protein n=1 Tax=Acrocarpospora phusangensis TaxID=1070424 RepID=A0A919QHI9_9ACTN|nr:DUF4395 domain-containing protein [Acrocarpospora phusangensis]GIH29062.1 membrane protein [Acrocarpospora phusangensis]
MQVDPRGLRFGAAVTTLVLAAVLITGNPWLLAVQTVVFVLGAFGAAPYALFFKRFVRPRLGPPRELEDAAPPRFAQGVGMAFALVGLIGFAAGVTPLALGATAAALLAAFLNAAFGLCLGCEAFLIIRRLQPGRIS